jgi:putative membrane protein insertion efficiency factor
MRIPLTDIPKTAVLVSIRAYQRTLSPDHGLVNRLIKKGYCKYWPSCSQYTYEAVDEFGIIKGVWLGFRRILRCNPWSDGGIDRIPNKK